MNITDFHCPDMDLVPCYPDLDYVSRQILYNLHIIHAGLPLMISVEINFIFHAKFRGYQMMTFHADTI